MEAKRRRANDLGRRPSIWGVVPSRWLGCMCGCSSSKWRDSAKPSKLAAPAEAIAKAVAKVGAKAVAKAVAKGSRRGSCQEKRKCPASGKAGGRSSSKQLVGRTSLRVVIRRGEGLAESEPTAADVGVLTKELEATPTLQQGVASSVQLQGAACKTPRAGRRVPRAGCRVHCARYRVQGAGCSVDRRDVRCERELRAKGPLERSSSRLGVPAGRRSLGSQMGE